MAFTAGAANGGTITNYQYSTDGGDTFTSLASPSTSSPFTITGLTNGTAYTVVIRAITSTKTGADSAAMVGTPCGTPSSTTTAATNVQPTTATLNGHLTGSGNPLANVSFRWGTSQTLTGGNEQTINANLTSLAATADQYPVFANLAGLTAGTTYYFEVSGTYSNGAITTTGGIQSFVTPASVVPPTVATDPATNIAATTATINGTGTSNGASSTLSFIWGTSQTLTGGNEQTVTPSQSPLASGASNAPFYVNLTGLTGGTTYYFRAIISNANSGGPINGIIRSFTTPTPTTPQVSPSPPQASPTTTTTPSRTVNPTSSTGEIAGTVWIDADADDTKDASEVWIPGITVNLTGPSTSTASTSSVGAFSFSSLAPGSYTVTAVLPSGLGLNISWDSQGNSDWIATVTVTAGQTARANFAAVGNVEVTGRVRTVDPGTEVNVDWGGVDKELDTPDDVTYQTKLTADRTFTLQSVPTGKYRVRVLSSRVNLTVNAAGATFDNGQIRIVAATPAIPATGSTLPSTTVPLSLAVISAGVVMAWVSRRRRVH